MSDQVFRNTAWGDVTIRENDPQWLKDQWYEKLGITGSAVPTASFVPTFRTVFGFDDFQQWRLNYEYFATMETAKFVADKFGTGEVVEIPFGGSGGLFKATGNEYHVKLKDGRLINAGILASYYERNPEDKFPGLAEKFILKGLESVSVL